jgi:flagellar biosynthesis/type III secretory pathway M-ring protein FliF/YscJ
MGINNNDPVKPADLKSVADLEITRIRSLVRPLIAAKEDDQVVVDWYYDSDEIVPMMVEAGNSVGLVAMAKDFGPQVGLGVLALVALFSVVRIARRTPAIMGVPTAQEAGAGSRGGSSDRDEPPLETFSVPLAVGEAHEMSGVLVGREVDENVIRTQQIVKQISELVKEDPRLAAGLVERWITKGP